MRDERLDKELPENADDALDLLILASTLGNPGLGLRPRLVEGQETTLTSTLDELIGLRDEFGAGLEQPRVGDLSLVQDISDIGILSKVQRCQSRRRVVLGGLGKRAGLEDGGTGEVVVDDGLAIGLEIDLADMLA